MKYIAKDIDNEPRSLKEIRSTPGAGFDDCEKGDIREALLREQGHLCAYCMDRISDRTGKDGLPNMKIEHYNAQSTAPDKRLSYLNMLGVCRGGYKGPSHLLHCDVSRKNQPLLIDPRKKDCERLIKYTPSGEIFSDHETVDNDLKETLNLNIRPLRDGRAAAIQIAKQSLKAYSAGAIQRQINKLEQLNHKGQYTEFCQAAIYILRKKLRQL